MRARTKRNSNIEIIKLIAVFLIILSSALPYGATYRGGDCLCESKTAKRCQVQVNILWIMTS